MARGEGTYSNESDYWTRVLYSGETLDSWSAELRNLFLSCTRELLLIVRVRRGSASPAVMRERVETIERRIILLAAAAMRGGDYARELREATQ